MTTSTTTAANGAAPDAHRHPFRWLMLTGASLVYACFGALLASMAVLVAPIRESLQLSAAEMGTVLAAW
ncbi:MAG: hypothetical protein AAFX58_05650, partial [Pseudomonadota bacterium]